MGCGIERDVLKRTHMADLVRPLGAGVLAGHDVPAEIHCDGVGAVHPAFLASGLDRPTALYRSIKLVDPLTQAKSVRDLHQRLEDRPGQAVQVRRLEAPCPDGSRGVIDIHDTLEPDEDVRPNLLGEPGRERPKVVMLARQNRVEPGLFRPLGQQSFNPAPLVRVV